MNEKTVIPNMILTFPPKISSEHFMTVQIHQSIFVDDELVQNSPGFKGDMENGKSLKLGAAKQNTPEN